jgi:hypothetical protein
VCLAVGFYRRGPVVDLWISCEVLWLASRGRWRESTSLVSVGLSWLRQERWDGYGQLESLILAQNERWRHA